MNAIEYQTDLFLDMSPDGLLRAEFILLHASTEKVRRACFAKNGALQKIIDSQKQDIDALKSVMSDHMKMIEELQSAVCHLKNALFSEERMLCVV